MNSDIINAIKNDHKSIRGLIKEGLKHDIALPDKKLLFERLSVMVIAHAKSEEAVIYAQTCNNPQTKKDAFEGFEEHALVELLIEEIKNEQNEDKWEAKFTVVCELLSHHIEEEEKEYLPKLKSIFNEEQRNEMSREYQEMYERLIKAQESIAEPDYPIHLRNH